MAGYVEGRLNDGLAKHTHVARLTSRGKAALTGFAGVLELGRLRRTSDWEVDKLVTRRA